MPPYNKLTIIIHATDGHRGTRDKILL